MANFFNTEINFGGAQPSGAPPLSEDMIQQIAKNITPQKMQVGGRAIRSGVKKLEELLTKLPTGTDAAQQTVAAEMAARKAAQEAAYAPHTLPTDKGAEELEKAKKTLGKADGGGIGAYKDLYSDITSLSANYGVTPLEGVDLSAIANITQGASPALIKKLLYNIELAHKMGASFDEKGLAELYANLTDDGSARLGYDPKSKSVNLSYNASFAEGGVVSLDDIINEALQSKANGGVVKMAKAGLVGEGVNLLTKSLRAAKAAEAGEELAKLRPRDIADITLKKEKPLPAPLPRAKAKSKEEISQIAERVAPQMTGEFVRKTGKTENVAGKSRKQWDLEKELQHDITRSREVPEAETISLEPHKGSVMLSLPGDTSISDFDIHSIGGVGLREPSRQYGGPRFGLGHPEEAGWASGLVPAGGFQRRVTEASRQYGDAPVLANYMAMGPEGMNYALHYSDALLKSIDPAKMTAIDIDHTNRIIRAGNPAAKIPEAPDFPGIEHPEAAYLYLAENPATRKHFNSVMQLTNTTEALGLPSGLNVRHAITEPDLRDLERGMTGYSLLQMEPGVTTLKPSAHPTYSHDIPGKFLGRAEVQTPYELTFPDTVAQIRANPRQAGSEFGTLQMGGGRQIIDQQLLDEISQYRERMKQLTGKKDGGLAEGGVPVKRDVSQLFPLKVPADNAELKPQPKYPLLDKASQGVQAVHDFISAPFGYENPAGEMVSSFLEVPSIAKALGNIAYDMPMTTGSGMTTDLRPEVSGAAMGVAPLVGPAVKTAKKVGKALAPTAAEMALDVASKYGVDPRMNIIKPKGGNWLNNSVEESTKRVKRYNAPPIDREAELLAEIEEATKLNDAGYLNAATMDMQQLRIDMAADKWVEKKLNPYIKNEMGTETDPIRLGIERRAAEGEKLKQVNQARLAKMEADIAKAKAAGKDTTLSEGDLEKAREKFADEEYIATQGLFHKTIPEGGWIEPPPAQPYLTNRRKREGMPLEDVSLHPAAKRWERAVDMEIEPIKAARYQEDQDILNKNPYLSKIEPDLSVYGIDPMADATFEFRHMMDEIKEAMNPQTVLPKSLRISPKDLEKMTVDDVSALSGKISAWRDTQKAKENLEIANNPAVHLFKEYTENNPKGVSWRQIKLPEGLPKSEAQAAVREATEYEGEMMRHCVGGAGHCEPLLRGDVEIYSLRDAKGEPHVTIEVEPNKYAPRHEQVQKYMAAAEEEAKKLPNGYTSKDIEDIAVDMAKKEMPKNILEIKGKNNRKPNPEYIPFVQDFVKSGNFKNVGDSAYADMYQPNPSTLSKFMPENPELQNIGQAQRLSLFNKAQEAGELNYYLTREDWENILLKYSKQKGYAQGGAVCMAEGGVVSLDDIINQALARAT